MANWNYYQGKDYTEHSYWQSWVDDPEKAFVHTNPALIFAFFHVLGLILMAILTPFKKPWLQRPRRGQHKAWIGRRLGRYKAQKNEEDRLHIVWEIDENKVKQLADRADGEGQEAGDGVAIENVDNTRRLERLFPAYGWTQSIEYLSVTHGKWLQAVVDVSTANTPNGPQPRYATSLAGTSQRRHGVNPALMRFPLCASEPCEVYLRDEHTWSAASVEDRRTVGQIVTYKVTLADAGFDLPPGWAEAVDQVTGRTYYVNAAANATRWDRPTAQLEVAATFVRRRFPEGLGVEAYLGPARGWVAARVCPGEQIAIRDGEEEQHLDRLTPRSPAVAGKAGAAAAPALTYWAKVPVLPLDDPTAMVRLVPSYYLRPAGAPEVKCIDHEENNREATETLNFASTGPALVPGAGVGGFPMPVQPAGDIFDSGAIHSAMV